MLNLESMRTFPTLLLCLALSVAGALVGAAPTAYADQGGPDPRTCQTSDCLPGAIAPEVPEYLRGTTTYHRKWWYDAAPGCRVAKWIQNGPRGRVRYFVVRTWWKHKGITMDYAHAPKVRTDMPLSDMLKRTPGVVAGINGDFFDIGDSGAPLGLGRARGNPLIHGIDYGWNNAFWIDRKNDEPHIDLLHPKAWIVGRPGITISNLNSPQVKPLGIGIYTPRFGDAVGTRWVDGYTRYARVVHVKDGKVTSNSTTNFPTGPFEGTYLVARGPQQRRQLAALEVGSKVQVGWRLPEGPAFAITGQSILLKDGKILATDDSELHPRTMVGIDHDGKQIIWVVVDGRRESTTGFTMVQEARLMKRLGAEDALNLDGGGSSTLVTRKSGSLVVQNTPSDGQERWIPNGLRVTYTKPKQGRKHH